MNNYGHISNFPVRFKETVTGKGGTSNILFIDYNLTVGNANISITSDVSFIDIKNAYESGKYICAKISNESFLIYAPIFSYFYSTDTNEGVIEYIDITINNKHYSFKHRYESNIDIISLDEIVISHNNLSDRDADNQHPISAIAELQDILNSKQPVGDYATNYDLRVGLALKADAELLTAYATLIDLAAGLAGKANINDLAKVAKSGDYDDLVNKPNLFSGDYNDLSNKPDLFSGDYSDLTNKPDLSIYALLTSLADVATSGDYRDLLNLPNLFSGDYNDLTNKPTIPIVPANISAFRNDIGYLTTDTLPIFDGEITDIPFYDGTIEDGGGA